MSENSPFRGHHKSTYVACNIIHIDGVCYKLWYVTDYYSAIQLYVCKNNYTQQRIDLQHNSKEDHEVQHHRK